MTKSKILRSSIRSLLDSDQLCSNGSQFYFYDQHDCFWLINEYPTLDGVFYRAAGRSGFVGTLRQVIDDIVKSR